MGIFIFVTVVALILWGIKSLIQKGVDKLYDGLDKLNKVNEYPNLNKINKEMPIGKTYEKILEDPTKYTQDERDLVKEKFKQLLAGNIKDTNLYHAPSERINNYPNKNYIRYLEGQKKYGENLEWINNELQRIEKVYNYESVRQSFIRKLTKMGAPAILGHKIVNQYRLSNYKPEDWKRLVDSVNEYLKRYSVAYIHDYLDITDDIDKLCDPIMMECYHIMDKNDVSEQVSSLIINNSAEIKDIKELLEQAVFLAEQYDDDIDTVIVNIIREQKSEELKDNIRKEMEV